jgi:four helix bundle protein
MGTIVRFEDILAWQQARSLANSVYAVTGSGEAAADLELRNQLRRAALSTMLNIAEGFARATDRDFIRFLSYAHGSLAEIQAALYLSLDQHYIDPQQFDALYEHAAQTSLLIRRLEQYLTKPGAPPR